MLSVESQCMAIGDDVAIMFRQGGSEAVMSIAIANKIKKFRTLRMQGGFQSAAPGIANWPRRQARKAVGVIGELTARSSWWRLP